MLSIFCSGNISAKINDFYVVLVKRRLNDYMGIFYEV